MKQHDDVWFAPLGRRRGGWHCADAPDPPYTVTFTPAARRPDRLPLAAAAALYEHLTGPVARNPFRLGKPLDPPFENVWTTRRGGCRALHLINRARTPSRFWPSPTRRHAYARGLDLDARAVAAAVTLPFHNGRTEGVNSAWLDTWYNLQGGPGD